MKVTRLGYWLIRVSVVRKKDCYFFRRRVKRPGRLNRCRYAPRFPPQKADCRFGLPPETTGGLKWSLERWRLRALQVPHFGPVPNVRRAGRTDSSYWIRKWREQ